MHDLAPSGRKALQALPPPGFAGLAAESLHNTAGIVEEYLAFVKPWGFLPEDVPGPVHIWRGNEDELLPLSWIRELERRIPSATLHLLEGADHLLPLTHYGVVMDTLLTEVPGPA